MRRASRRRVKPSSPAGSADGVDTFLDAEVTQSFTGSALAPAFNPAFPGVPIGAFAPLVGARPFRRPAHSGNLMASYTDGPVTAAMTAFFSGRRDGSTFLSDQFFGNSLLLPNANLEPAYQKVDLSAAYRVHPRLRLYTSIENPLIATTRRRVRLSRAGLDGALRRHRQPRGHQTARARRRATPARRDAAATTSACNTARERRSIAVPWPVPLSVARPKAAPAALLLRLVERDLNVRLQPPGAGAA